jgi:N-acetylglutamate synthase-like GNAT family acetyltransferase
MVTIIDFEDRYAPEFKRLNAEWLIQYDLMESHDLEILDNPREWVLDRGGHIFLAVQDGIVVGTSALMKAGEETFELVKMSVSPRHQGQGISKKLLEACLIKARELGARKLILFSNSRLLTALSLYSQFGFRHIPVLDSPFVTADVKMELLL